MNATTTRETPPREADALAVLMAITGENDTSLDNNRNQDEGDEEQSFPSDEVGQQSSNTSTAPDTVTGEDEAALHSRPNSCTNRHPD